MDDLTPEKLAEWRESAEAALSNPYHQHTPCPSRILALLGALAASEAAREETERDGGENWMRAEHESAKARNAALPTHARLTITSPDSLLARAVKAEQERDEAQEHVAYHLRDFVPGGDDKVTGDLAVDMTRYAERMKAAKDAAEAAYAALVARIEALIAAPWWSYPVPMVRVHDLRPLTEKEPTDG